MLFYVSLLLAASATAISTPAIRTSSACTYVCPALTTDGKALGESGYGTAGEITCDYDYKTSTAPYYDILCTYDSSSGALTASQGALGSYCPTTAVSSNYQCPTVDNGGNALGNITVYYASNELLCQYGLHSFGGYISACVYSTSSGAILNVDDPTCPSNAGC